MSNYDYEFKRGLIAAAGFLAFFFVVISCSAVSDSRRTDAWIKLCANKGGRPHIPRGYDTRICIRADQVVEIDPSP